MVNEEQQLEACYSLLRYYTKKLKETTKEHERCKYLIELSELDIEIYDLEKYLEVNNPEFLKEFLKNNPE